MRQRDRDRFDSMLEAEIARLPDAVRDRLEEVPVIVEDWPADGVAESLGAEDLMGLHEGVPLTERGVEDDGRMPDRITLYRAPILAEAGPNPGALREQIRITLLHEIGHHFGLDEDDLERLGYG